MAPLLPPFLIMTGPRGPEQREGRLSRTASGKGGHRREGERDGSSRNRHFVLRRNKYVARHKEWSHLVFPSPPREVNPQPSQGHAHCRTGAMGSGKPLQV